MQTNTSNLAITGNLGNMRYRADLQFRGAHPLLKEKSPLGQYVLMEYH